MAESLFWRDLEQRFSELQAACRDSLQASWTVSRNGTTDYQWRLKEATESARKAFIFLADRAAVELGHKAGTGWIYWLDLLKRDSPNYRDMAFHQGDSNGQGGKTAGGIILRLCGASAQYCIYCEGRMISERRRKNKTEMLPATGVTESLNLSSVSRGREKPGAKADLERAWGIAGIVAKMAPGGNWKNHWEDLCEAFDSAQIWVPRAWKTHGFRSWSDCDDRERVVKVVLYQLKLATRKR